MASPQDNALVTRVSQDTGYRIRLKPWESVKLFNETDNCLTLAINTYEVQIMAREDRYNRAGARLLIWVRHPTTDRWVLDFDETVWDASFEPYIERRFGRTQTVQELNEQREFEKMCYRPGPGLDSYSRVLQGGYSPSEKKIEGHY